MLNRNSTEKLIIMGPCSLESWEQIESVCKLAYKHQVSFIRAAIFKPRTNPDSFQGLGVNGLPILEKIKDTFPKLNLVTEVCSLSQLELVSDYIDVVQIGARNMQNFELLKQVGKYLDHNQKVILKRGFSSTLDEWLSAAKYLIQSGAEKNQIILCERGIRTFAAHNGVALDFASAHLAKQNYGYQVILDPSHGTKSRELVLPMADATLKMNFDGVMIECHPYPDQSYSDAAQAISLEAMDEFLSGLHEQK